MRPGSQVYGKEIDREICNIILALTVMYICARNFSSSLRHIESTQSVSLHLPGVTA